MAELAGQVRLCQCDRLFLIKVMPTLPWFAITEQQRRDLLYYYTLTEPERKQVLHYPAGVITTIDPEHPAWYKEARASLVRGRVHVLELEVNREQLQAWLQAGPVKRGRIYQRSHTQFVQGYTLQLNLALFPTNARLGLSMHVGLAWPGLLQSRGLLKVQSVVFEHQHEQPGGAAPTWTRGPEIRGGHFIGSSKEAALDWHPVQA